VPWNVQLNINLLSSNIQLFKDFHALCHHLILIDISVLYYADSSMALTQWVGQSSSSLIRPSRGHNSNKAFKYNCRSAGNLNAIDKAFCT